MSRTTRFSSLLVLTLAVSAFGAGKKDNYPDVVKRTTRMALDAALEKRAAKYGLDVVDVTWEDTGRYKNSAVGPNISDLTILVGYRTLFWSEVHAMPVIRFPNFSDKTADLDPRDFTLLVGNEKGEPLRRISLYEFLKNPTAYLRTPGDWKAPNKSLLAPRDSRVLVSAQACFLPIPKGGKASFSPVIFNYQSTRDDPAVLTILATREGSSVTVIDNVRDRFYGRSNGQRLFYNDNGQRTSLTGERESDFQSTDVRLREDSVKAAKESGLNMVLLIQIPLKQRKPEPTYGVVVDKSPPPPSSGRVENAVIGHGKSEGPFTELNGIEIKRDPRFPVRVTVQFYKATDDGIVSDRDLQEIAAQISRVYAQSKYVGSLVVGGDTGRVTESTAPKKEPAGWWADFWKRYRKNQEP